MGTPDILKPEMKRSRIEIQQQADTTVRKVKERYSSSYPENLLAVGLGSMYIFLTEFAPTPRSTEYEGPMGDAILAWAERNDFHAEKDKTGNVGVVIPGDNRLPIVVLQFHQDIVAVAKPDSPTHPEKYGVITELIEGRERDLGPKEVFNDDLWIQAKNGLTSLGADNGAGGSVSLQVAKTVAGQKEPHGNIVILGTVGEEKDFRGAKGITFSPDGQVLPLLERASFIINDDMEMDNDKPLAIDGAFGVEEFTLTKQLPYEHLPENMQLVTLSVDGLLGGHSGLYPERPHAGVVLMDQLKQALGKPSEQYHYLISSFEAGEKFNAIGERGSVTIAIHKEEVENVMQLLAQQQKLYTDETVVLTTSIATDVQDVLTEDISGDVFAFLGDLATLHGPDNYYAYKNQRLFTRALNLGAISLNQDHGLKADIGVRIGQPAEYGKTEPQLRAIAEKLPGTTIEALDVLDMWPPDEKSILPQIVKEEYQKLPFEKKYDELDVEVIQAGLELGTLHTQFPDSQNITLGMWIERIHKAGERMNVKSFLENSMLFLEVVQRLSRGEISTKTSRRSQAA